MVEPEEVFTPDKKKDWHRISEASREQHKVILAEQKKLKLPKALKLKDQE